MIEIRQLTQFAKEHKLELNGKLLKYLVMIGLESVELQIKEVSFKAIKQLAKLEKSKHPSASKIKNELQQIKHEIEKLSKNLETNLTQQPTSQQPSQKWWSSPSPSKVDPTPSANNSQHKIKKADAQQLTPKVTESPAPTLQYNMPPRPSTFKHHLDDSEMQEINQYVIFRSKKALWSQREPQSQANSTSINQRQNTFVSMHSNSERTVQSQSIEQSHRQSSPQFKIEESSQSEKKIPINNASLISKPMKENQNPQQIFKKKKRQRKSSSNQKQINKVPNYLKNVQSKIKEQIVQDKQIHKQELKPAISQSQATFKQLNRSDQMIDNIPENESQCQTILPSEIKQMLSSRNPTSSLNIKQTNLNEGFEDFFQFSMKYPQFEAKHQRFISQGTDSSNENTPYSKPCAQSISLLSSSNIKKSQSSGKAGFIETNKKTLSQLEGSNKMIDIANSFLNSPFVRQLCTESNVKQRLFRELSNIKEKGKIYKFMQIFQESSDQHSSSSSNFSLFNPKDELKSNLFINNIIKDFFQKEFLEKQHQIEDEIFQKKQIMMNFDNSSNMSFTY